MLIYDQIGNQIRVSCQNIFGAVLLPLLEQKVWRMQQLLDNTTLIGLSGFGEMTSCEWQKIFPFENYSTCLTKIYQLIAIKEYNVCKVKVVCPWSHMKVGKATKQTMP